MELTRKNILIGLAVLVAAAAGWAYYAKAAAGPWTGCYVGGAASYNAATAMDTFGAEGPGIAALAGCDVQVDRFVVGAWGDYGHKTFEWALTDVDVNGWAAGGRAGVLLTDTALIYALVGYTEVNAEIATFDVDLTGIVYGGGAEISLGRGFFTRAEYQYSDLETDGLNSIDASTHSARLGVTYKFGGSDVEKLVPGSAPLK